MDDLFISFSNTHNSNDQTNESDAGKNASSLQNCKGYIGFDHEIANDISDFTKWRFHRPLGITCAALYLEGEKPMLWYDVTPQKKPAPKMSREYAGRLVSELIDWVEKGYMIFTWNGLGFDFDVLAEESNMWEECRHLALTHVDMMFHFFCLKGFPLKLDKAAKGMGLSGKTEGMSGEQAPTLWQQGQFDQVLEYVGQDSRTTVEVAQAVEKKHYLEWISNSGKRQRVDFPNGWLTVEQALKLPLPDTSWMRTRMNRNHFLAWTNIK